MLTYTYSKEVLVYYGNSIIKMYKNHLPNMCVSGG